MEHYTRGKQVEEVIAKEKICIPNLPHDYVWIQVSSGSKMRNLLRCAVEALQRNQSVVWTGVGPSLGKAVSCAEIAKRQFKTYQISKICYSKLEEHWEPKLPELEPLIVQRDIPTIHILLSRTALDTQEPGYQAPGRNDVLWRSGTSGAEPGSRKSDGGEGRRAGMLKQMTGPQPRNLLQS